MDDFFVTALVRASTCHHHAHKITSTARSWPFTTSHHKVRRKGGDRSNTRAFHSERSCHGAAVTDVATNQVSRGELKNLVDIYGQEWDDLPSDQEPVAKLEVVQTGLESDYFSGNPIRPQIDDPLTKHVVEHIIELLDNKATPAEPIYELYLSLPSPRASYLNVQHISQLLSRIAIVPRKPESVMLRYLSVLDDMKEASMPIYINQWNTAIHLAGHHFERHSLADVESAISIWKEMESSTPERGDHVTFNILFDVAVKGEKYMLAEIIHKEAIKRGLKFDRISRMAQIFYHGVRRDGNGVRKAYMELVEAGEIVDTAVLTNVLTGLINAGELPAAEETFQRMKTMHAEKAGATAPPQQWRERRELRKLLTDAGEKYRADTENRRVFQDAAPIAPDWRTYKPFIKYHSEHSGNIDRVLELLEEMDVNVIPLNGPIFFWVFIGFQKFGGVRYSSWRASRLELLWEHFLKRCDESPEDVWLDHGVATAAVSAFHKCVGRQRAQEVWVDIRSRWVPANRSLHLVNNILRSRPGEHLPDQRSFELD
jgi:hypothetical protein